MNPLAIKDNVYWVGAVDYSCRDFHGYSRSPHGTTYNTYLVLDEKITLFDTVKSGSISLMLQRIRELIDPEKIDYLVVNHVELDHAGYLGEIVNLCKLEKIFGPSLVKRPIKGHDLIMAMKNAYAYHQGIAEEKIRQVVTLFAANLNASQNRRRYGP